MFATLDYDVTRVGVIYVMVTLVIGIAALNTANNLLYIVVAAMLAAILVSGVVSAMVLRDFELEIRLPEHVFAGRPVLGKIAVRNPRARIRPFFPSGWCLRKSATASSGVWSRLRSGCRCAVRPSSSGCACGTGGCAG